MYSLVSISKFVNGPRSFELDVKNCGVDYEWCNSGTRLLEYLMCGVYLCRIKSLSQMCVGFLWEFYNLYVKSSSTDYHSASAIW